MTSNVREARDIGKTGTCGGLTKTHTKPLKRTALKGAFQTCVAFWMKLGVENVAQLIKVHTQAYQIHARTYTRFTWICLSHVRMHTHTHTWHIILAE